MLQFYGTLYVSGGPEDINTWVLEWKAEHKHQTTTIPEIIEILQLLVSAASVPSTYASNPLRDDLMNMLMKPLAPDAPPRTKFLITDLQFCQGLYITFFPSRSVPSRAMNPQLRKLLVA